ncbi:surface-adhesin E family protein [Paraburkholderia kirstenboschensis]|uniref:Surface-adhesin protein E-like domain-containing protein n=1 Tax=Paraburkholderia kirstenboschensis TaxID=1245436 RepID=A0ABZ0EFF6_9BURK|nr:surface-adhesin E family protein [Paraburkholderia kirstenboschensis]WOD15948.1 hypothetical protein RW095_22220 [Paraburkholderia kirstenboschensis]
MKKAKQGLAALAAMASFGAAHAADWVDMGSNSDVSYSIDANSMREVQDGEVRGWVKVEYTSTQYLNGKPFDTVKYNNRFFCKTRRAASGFAVFLNRGQVALRTDKWGEIRDVVPDSDGERFLDAACYAVATAKGN